MKKVLILGGSKGIGLSCTHLFSKSHQVTVLSRTRGNLPKEIDHISLDFKNINLVNEQASLLAKTKFDILINNSGGPKSEPFLNVKSDYLLEEINSHLISSHIITQALVPKMIENKFGRIINIISVTAKNPLPNMLVSNTIRGAMLNWSKTLSKELAQYNITTNNILPGYTNTERLHEVINFSAQENNISKESIEEKLLGQIPQARFGNPDELAKTVYFLASEDASYINGQSIAIDGGWLPCS